MSTRISSLALLAVSLAACGEQRTDQAADARIEAAQRRVEEERATIVCAHAGRPFARSCTVEQMAGSDGLVLTVRHADGAFHRLLVTHDGRGVIAADGAERAEVSVLGTDEILVVLGGDRYRLPATIKGAKPTA